jgi:hypothetical protein
VEDVQLGVDAASRHKDSQPILLHELGQAGGDLTALAPQRLAILLDQTVAAQILPHDDFGLHKSVTVEQLEQEVRRHDVRDRPQALKPMDKAIKALRVYIW